MKLEHGKTYLDREGERHTVELRGRLGHPSILPFICPANGRTYTHDGRFWPHDTDDWDLVAEAPASTEDLLVQWLGCANQPVVDDIEHRIGELLAIVSDHGNFTPEQAREILVQLVRAGGAK